MTLSDLGVPRPREAALPYAPIRWPAGLQIALPRPLTAGQHSWVQALSTRHTRRAFASELSLERLGELLYWCCRTVESHRSEDGALLEFRPYPSAGALHPIHVLLQLRRGLPWVRYEPNGHVLMEVPDSSEMAADVRSEADELLAMQPATLIALVAEPGKTAAKYENHESLVWRDAGVLLGYLSLVSELLGLSFCPLGVTGEPFVSRLLSPQSGLSGVGLALVGERSA